MAWQPDDQIFSGQTSVVPRAKIFRSLSCFSLAYLISIQYFRKQNSRVQVERGRSLQDFFLDCLSLTVAETVKILWALNNFLSNDKLISKSSGSNEAVFPLQNDLVACVIWFGLYFLYFKHLFLLSWFLWKFASRSLIPGTLYLPVIIAIIWTSSYKGLCGMTGVRVHR